MNPLFEDLGVGVGLRPTHRSEFIGKKPASVDWVEVISENFMPWRGRKLGRAFQSLIQVRETVPVALHGVSMNLGSADELDFEYLSRLKILIDELQPFVVSDHLAWTGVQGENLHDLLPLPYTLEALQTMAQKISQVQNFLGRRILIENPSSYLELRASEMSEPEFIVELLKKSDCGLLLDINNVFVSSVNHGFDAIDYLKQIPAERVGQIHLAGHSKRDGHLIDTHDTPVCQEVWNLFGWWVRQFGTRSTMIERDDSIPDWHELEQEVVQIGVVQNEAAIPR